MKPFRIIWFFNAMVSLVPAYFFVIGLMDGSVDSSNMGIWTLLLLGVGASLLGSWHFYHRNQKKLAWLLAGLLALPGIIMVIFVLILLFGDLHWQ